MSQSRSKKPLTISYKLHANQLQVFNDQSRFVVLCAGRRFGKTILAVIKCFCEAMNKPKSKVWLLAPTYKQAKEIAWARLLELIPREVIKKRNEVDLRLTLINGSEIALKGCDNEDSLRGVGLDYAVLDEMALIKPNVFPEIIRPMLADTQGKALFIGTPAGKNHFWKMFTMGERGEHGYSSHRFKTQDNPFIARSEIKKAQEELSDAYFKQEFEASFEDFSGLVYNEFSLAHHVIEPFDIPNWYESVGAIDPAMTGTTAMLMAHIDENGVLYITDEFYEQNIRVSEACSRVRGWKPGRWLIDPSAGHQTYAKEGRLYSFADEFRDNGISPAPAENDVNAGINRVAEYLKKDRIKIFKTCKNLIDEIQQYHWSEERETALGVSVPKPFKSYDHACDCLRYIVMSRASQANVPKPRSYDRAIPMAGELIGAEPKSAWERWRG